MHGKEHSEQDKQTWEAIVAVIEDFKAADKYVMAVPMWNFSLPYRLKQYLDILIQPGYTFAVTEDGDYNGLVTDKPVFIAYSRGGAYPPGTDMEAFDFQTKYLELALGFMGLTDVRSVVAEPTLMNGPEVAGQAKADALVLAKRIAETF